MLCRLDGDVVAFADELEDILARFRSRQESKAKPTQARAARRYLQAMACGKTPTAWMVPSETKELLRDIASAYGGDLKRAASSMLHDMESVRPGRPRVELNDWLIARVAMAYSRHFAGATSKNSTFAKRVLPIIFQAVGLMTRDFSKRV